ncbi:MAG TPA: radical SAM family heme chaperone HemW [Chitinispirillaceae bacterium]|nr:radical SAM family heme chaperone HemW [Chitinispirillaceae bacterium]
MKSASMLSIYIHIPFCAAKCRYCDFYSIGYDSSLADRYIEALAMEWNLICREKNLHEPQIVTLYFGGGTPSILSLKQWEKIGRTLISQFNSDALIECSVECNPESFTDELARLFMQLGVNRLTFGVQSLCDRELSFAGRIHSAQTALNVLHKESLAGFNSIGADLIYGLAGQTPDSLSKTLEKLTASEYVKHCSAYELTINENTPFGRHSRILPLPDEDTVYEMTSMVRTFLLQKGFEQYEISNFTMKNYRCIHNEIYWDHQNYIGLGCAAHSYLHPFRWANIQDINQYIKKISNNEYSWDFHEFIDQDTLAREMLFLGLRRVDGINTEIFSQRVGKSFDNWVNMEKIEDFISKGWLYYSNPQYQVTPSGLLFADTMARELF